MIRSLNLKILERWRRALCSCSAVQGIQVLVLPRVCGLGSKICNLFGRPSALPQPSKLSYRDCISGVELFGGIRKMCDISG